MRTYRYSPLTKITKTLYRRVRPVPPSPWTAGPVDDICKVNLVPPEKLLSFFADCIALLETIRGEDIGDYLEFGVFNGNSIGSMFLASRDRTHPPRLFGFDAFAGLPADAEQEDDGVWRKGFYTCSFEEMQSCLNRRMVDPSQIIWIQGWYEQTLLPKTASEHGISAPGIVFVDCDAYSSSKAVLQFVGPLLSKPAILCFDDWKLNNLDLKGMGEYRSFDEFLESHPDLVAKEIASYNRKSRSFLISPK